MKVRDRMSTEVVTVDLNTSITEAFRLMKENNIRRLPVMDNDNLVGIITLADLNQAAPSSATSLSIHELNYLLAKTKIKDILDKNQRLVTVGPDNYIETAAKLMRIYMVSGLPVIDQGRLVGIVTETDIFDAFIDILGVKKPHSRIDLFVADKPGVLAEITSIIAKANVNILNTIVYHDKKVDRHKVIIRVETFNCDDIVAQIQACGYEVESVIVKDTSEL